MAILLWPCIAARYPHTQPKIATALKTERAAIIGSAPRGVNVDFDFVAGDASSRR